jgi:hypothetical protein
MMTLIDAGKPENSICKMVLIKNILDLDSQKIDYFWISYMQFFFFCLKSNIALFLDFSSGIIVSPAIPPSLGGYSSRLLLRLVDILISLQSAFIISKPLYILRLKNSIKLFLADISFNELNFLF